MDCLATNYPKKIILNESAFLPRFFPNNHLECHKAEGEQVLTSIKTLSARSQSENLFIHGPSGSGKSTIVRWAMKMIAEERSVIVIFTNCRRYNTSMAIYTRIAEALGEPVSRRGRASDEIFDRIVDLVIDSRKPIILILDEIEALVEYDNARILDNIARIDESQVLFKIIAISDNGAALSKLSQKTRDILGFTKIEIPPLSRNELLDLLKIRASSGLRSGAYDDSIIEEIANIVAIANGSANFALKTLWRAARGSEDQGLDSITKEELKRIKASLELDRVGLSHEEITIIELLENGPVSSSQLYSLFYRRIPKTKRQIRNYLRVLEEKGIIETRFVRGKYNYGSTIIQLSSGWKDR